MTHSDSPQNADAEAANQSDSHARSSVRSQTRAQAGAVETPFELTVTREFVAQHFLTVPDPGPEGTPHSHRYRVEVRFGGPELNEYGYLVDIDAVDATLDRLEERYRDALLNDLPEFEGLNPSVEHFARLFGDRIAEGLSASTPTHLTVRIWEDDAAWASHRRRLE
jgi:6-pyruvoyltetrahydropterin/6-carboxytetrahydropterin synthase